MYKLKVLDQVNESRTSLLGQWVQTYPGLKILCKECNEYHEYKVPDIIIPSLYEYDRCWIRAGLENPLYYQWKYGELHDDEYETYLKEVDKTLQIQEGMWGVDEITREHELYKRFKVFSESISLLTIFTI